LSRAAYPDGRAATGADACAAYSRESEPMFKRLGGSIVWSGRFELMLIGRDAERWDRCFIAQYPGVAAFVAIRSTARPSNTVRRPSRIPV
jgi:hypothetical protein